MMVTLVIAIPGDSSVEKDKLVQPASHIPKINNNFIFCIYLSQISRLKTSLSFFTFLLIHIFMQRFVSRSVIVAQCLSGSGLRCAFSY